MIKIEYYSSNIGVFIKSEYHFNNLIINDIKFSDGILRKNFRQFNIENIEKVEIKTSPKHQTVGYKLKVPEVASDKIPAYIKIEDTEPFVFSDDDICHWKNYEEIRGLYVADVVQVEGSIEPVEYNLICLGNLQIDNIESPAIMEIKVSNPVKETEPKGFDLKGIVTYSDLEEMLTPEFLLHERPCKLTSKQMYSIVRSWVKANINPKCAEITSDYDFCFTVKRKLYHPTVTIRTEIKKQNGSSYATPKFTSHTKSFDKIEIFAMTWAGCRGIGGYEGYTCIPPLEGSSLRDISERLKYYLETLMEEINKEVDQCQCCKGYGYTVKSISSNFEKEWSKND